MNDQSLYLLTEAAERTGLTVEAIRQRIKRGKLEAVKGNDGLLRVRLTTADLAGVDRSSTGRTAPTVTSHETHDNRLNKALQDAAEARGEAAALRQWAERAEERLQAAGRRLEEERLRAAAEASQLRTEGEAARLKAAAAEAREGELRAERDRLLREWDTAQLERKVAEDELTAWTVGGPLARAWRALIYRRGRP